VVPTVVLAMIANQYGAGWKRGARICAHTAAANSTPKMPVPMR